VTEYEPPGSMKSLSKERFFATTVCVVGETLRQTTVVLAATVTSAGWKPKFTTAISTVPPPQQSGSPSAQLPQVPG
jgi:hypothetical protein